MLYSDEEALQVLVASTASVIGDEFFPVFVENLAKVLDVRHALISILEDTASNPRASARAFWTDGKLGAPFEYELEHTACATVLRDGKTCFYPHNASQAFPQNPCFVLYEAEAYLGVPLFDKTGGVIGLIAIFDSQPLAHEQRAKTLMELFASRVSAELERQRTEAALKQSEAIAQIYAKDLEKSMYRLKQTQAQLIQTEKISSLGQLVAGVAHEINNPVSSISGNLPHLQRSVADLIHHLHLYHRHYPEPIAAILQNAKAVDLDYSLEDLPKIISTISLSAERIHAIMQALRNYSRVDDTEMRAVDLHGGIETALIILSHRLKANSERPAIRVVKKFAPLPPVKCYPGKLNQVFINLLANAIDALEESNISQTYREIEQLPNIITIQTDLDHDHVTIQISDNGMGIPEPLQHRLFQPFFTTKPEGKGTGLGLSICHQIVIEEHKGSIECKSSQGQGTTFTVQIPLT
jgi:signal transduction histidine kinase